MNDVQSAVSRGWRWNYFSAGTIPFWGLHLAAVAGVVWLGFSWTGLALAVALYYARMFFVTAGYHRYFAHRSFKTSRPVQFLFAVGASMTLQKGVLWWAAHHRRHHRDSDTPSDPHTPVHYGFWWAHLGWILSPAFSSTDEEKIRDLAKYPELRLIDKLHLVPGLAMAGLLFAVGGWHALIWGFAVSTVLLWHGTFTINSLTHVIGTRRYDSADESRNHWLLALITMGEGWHNNHHHYQLSARQGFVWYEIDMSYYILKLMSWARLVRDLRVPPRYIIEDRRKHQKTELPVAEAEELRPAA